MTASEEQMLSLEEVAERLQVSGQTIRRWIKGGRLMAYKPGLEWRIRPSDLEAFLETRGFPKALRSSPIAAEDQAGEERNSEDVWKSEYLALAGEMLDKWEGELEEKLALAESDPVRFFDWVEGVRAVGRPLRSGLDSGYTAPSVYLLEPAARAAWFVGPWNDLWDHIEEVATLTQTLTEEDQERLVEVSEDARRPSRFDGSA